MNFMQIVAQTTAPGTAATKPAPGTVEPPGWITYTPFVILGVVMILFMSRGKKGQDRSRTDMLAKMKKGDEVQTIGGEYGRVVEVRDDRVLLKVDETSNTKIWYSRNAIHRVVTEEKAETK